MYNWDNSPTWIVFPAQKAFRLCEIREAICVQRWTLDRQLIGTELRLGRRSIKVESFEHARAIWLAIYDACRRGDEVFYLHEWKWNGK